MINKVTLIGSNTYLWIKTIGVNYLTFIAPGLLTLGKKGLKKFDVMLTFIRKCCSMIFYFWNFNGLILIKKFGKDLA